MPSHSRRSRSISPQALAPTSSNSTRDSAVVSTQSPRRPLNLRITLAAFSFSSSSRVTTVPSHPHPISLTTMSSPPLSTHTDITHFEQPILHKNEGAFGQDGSPITVPDRQRQLGARERSGASKLRHDILCGVGEFAGTFLFLFMAFMGAQSAIYNRGVGESTLIKANDNETILYIAISFGMSLLVVAWAFFRITGSAFNPAVTFALWLVGGCTARRAAGVIFAQMLGGIAAAGTAKGLTLGPFGVANRVAPGISYGQAWGVEMFTTGLLVFTVLMLAAEKSRTTFLAPVGIGMALFIGHIASIGWTGAGINPARTFGPDVVNGSFVGYTWLYYVGQMSGSLVATVLYVLLKNLDYQGVVGEIDVDHAASEGLLISAPMARAFSMFPGVHMKHAVRDVGVEHEDASRKV